MKLNDLWKKIHFLNQTRKNLWEKNSDNAETREVNQMILDKIHGIIREIELYEYLTNKKCHFFAAKDDDPLIGLS